ncbi:mitochondrial 54S ribosomal protein YmL41 [Coniothyrium glycines]
MDAIPITKKLIAFGSNKIYLPKFTVALVRTHGLSPYHARFLVPLDFSKYDLRDYLYHAYNVKCFNIRSFVKQMPVRDATHQQRHMFRPESKKYMTVEMEDPFVWPEVPKLTLWGKSEREKEVEDTVRENGVMDNNAQRAAARTLQDQVKQLLHKQVGQKGERLENRKTQMSQEELEIEARRVKEAKRAAAMDRLQLWEDRRTAKVAEANEGDFVIKA